MAEIKSIKTHERKKTSQNDRNQGNSTLFIGTAMGAILLVLAEIGCILAEIYYMFSHTGAIVVVIVTSILLLVVTAVFLYILKNAIFTKLEEQNRIYEELLRIGKGAYGNAAGSFCDGMDEAEAANIADRIREDVERIQKEQGEALYKKQMAVANVQIKRTRESVLNMVRANEYIIEVMEEKLGAESALASQGEALEELQKSVAQLYELCEKMAGKPEDVSAPAEEPEDAPVLAEEPEDAPVLAEEPEDAPVLAEESEILPEIEDYVQDMPFELEDEYEDEYEPETDELEMEEPAGVDIEPLPEEVLENIDMPEMDFELEEAYEPEIEEPEIEGLEIEEPEMEEPEKEGLEIEEPEMEEPEIEEPEMEEPEIEEPEMEESEQEEPMSMEEIEAMLNNL